MRKVLFSMMALIQMLAVSCQKQDAAGLGAADLAQVSLDIEVTRPVTKAGAVAQMSQADNVDIVYYEVWNSDWSKKLYPKTGLASAQVVDVQGEKRASVELTLVKAQDYKLIFWAQDKDVAAYDVSNLKAVKVDYSKIDGNQDCYDAFYATYPLVLTPGQTQTVTLTRPFAQLNFATDRMSTDLGPITLGETQVTVPSLATTFNTIKGEGEDLSQTPITFKASGVSTDELLPAKGKNYTWVTMDYVLMSGTEQTVTVDAVFNINGMDKPVKHTVASVPLKKNTKTNIVGDLFTDDASLLVVVKEGFNTPDEVVDVQ